MTKQVRAIFNGNVFCPEEPVDLKLNHHYLLFIESIDNIEESNNVEDDPAYDLVSLAVNTGIADFAVEHDHYLYGISKRGES